MPRKRPCTDAPGRALLAAFGFAVWACAPRPGSAPDRASLAIASAVARVRSGERAPRLFPPSDRSDTIVAGVERDGSRRVVAYGLRLIERPLGAIELSNEYLPVARAVQSVELPERLGGGFLFYLVASNATLFFRSKSFTGELEPFANLDLEAERVVLGFDRLYVFGKRPTDNVALDPEDGHAIALSGLPRAPVFGKMAFVDAWFGVVEVPFQGTLASFDAGLSWHPLPLALRALEIADGRLLLSADEGEFTLDPRGRLARREAQTTDEALRNPAPGAGQAEPAQNLEHMLASGPLGSRPLRTAVLHGFLDTDGSAVVASAGALVRVRLSDGSVVASDARGHVGAVDCDALRLGAGRGFLCSGRDGRSAIYEFVPPLGLRLEREFAGARYVAASENGALVIRGGCTDDLAQRPGAYCIRSRSGQFSELSVPEGRGIERVVALGDGRVAVLLPPALGAAGSLELRELGGATRKIALKLPHTPVESATLLQKGLWLDGFVEAPNGELAGWVAGAEPFVGVRVRLDGTVQVGRVQNGIERALISGTRALLTGRGGLAAETTDGGLEWSEVDLPAEFDAVRDARGDARAQGCSELGCVFAGFVRVGWRGGAAAPKLAMARLPEHTSLLSPGGNRWFLKCAPTGAESEASRAVAASAGRSTLGADEFAPAPWTAFLESAPPLRAPFEIGFDTPADNDVAGLHAYVWGKRGADWGRFGSFQVKALDRFSIGRGVWASAVTRSAWPDALSASEAFGYDGGGSPTLWRVVPEPSGRAAALIASARGILDLFLVEEGRQVGHVANAGRFGLAQLSSVVKLGNIWYATAYGDARSITLFRIDAGQVERIAEYREIAPGHTVAVGLVRGLRGEAIGIWVRSTSFYVYPLDPRSGQVFAPLEITPLALASLPKACDPDADGYLLSGPMSLDPNVEFGAGSQAASVRGFSARWVVSPQGVCIQALAAEADFVRRGAAAEARDRSVTPRSRIPLIVTERRPGGRRLGFQCSQ